MTVPKYGQFKYGTYRYGRYELPAVSGALGPHIRYRMRFHTNDGTKGQYVTMCSDRVSLHTQANRIRMRSNNNEWVYVQSESIDKEIFKVRIRSLNSNGEYSEWVTSDRANLKLI